MSPAAALVRRHDRDRYQTALFAPADRREALFALYAFNYEIARARETVTHPTLGRMRLEWWREAIAAAFCEGPFEHHPVIEAIITAIRKHELPREQFDGLIEARNADFDDDPPADLSALEGYAEGTSSRLIYLALDILGAREPAAAQAGHHVGIAYAFLGLLRALPTRGSLHRPFIPADIACKHGLDKERGASSRGSAGIRGAAREIAAAAACHIEAARRIQGMIPRRAMPALLPAVIAKHSLHRLARADYNLFDPRLRQPDPLQSWRLAAAALRWRF